MWAIGYWIVYPAWPTLNGYTKGVLNYSQRDQVQRDIEAWKSGHAKYSTQIAEMSLADIRKNDELFQFSIAGGAALFGENCAGCHGRGAQGGVGYPNLNDDDWLWGEFSRSSNHRLRRRLGHTKTHDTAMPRFGIDDILDHAEIATSPVACARSRHLDGRRRGKERRQDLRRQLCRLSRRRQAKVITKLVLTTTDI